MNAVNPYAAPQAEAQESETSSQSYYVVSPTKFLALMIGTVTLYSLYWFYRQWAAIKRRDRSDIWPVPRTIFAIFFTHSLFNRIDSDLRLRGGQADWSPGVMATVYVVCVVVTRILDNLSARLESLAVPFAIIGFLLIVPTVWSLFSAQRVINQVENDESGQSNAHFTAANIVWLIIGGIVWLLGLFGVYAIMTGNV